MRAEIITIGDELLIGQVVDTNSAWMAARLNEVGIELYQITSVHDERTHIIAAIEHAFEHADLVLTTGGLGPTKDDITKTTLCSYFDTHFIESSDVRAHIQQLYASRPEILNKMTASQWMVPASAQILTNRVGSAPIMVFHANEKMLIAMPGVPYEMKIAMQEQVLPYIAQKDTIIVHKTLLVSDISESELAILLEQFEQDKPSYITLAYLPKDGIIRLRLSSYGQATTMEMDTYYAQLKSLVSNYLVAEGDEPIECVLGSLLVSLGKTISTAESCTGGKLAALLSKHPGSSSFYYGSVISYDNSVKEQLLEVPGEVLKKYGAISEETVTSMVKSIRMQTNTDFSIAISGIAGPTGGTKTKPIGTVWMAWDSEKGTRTKCFHLGTLREQITDRACQKAMVELIKWIQHG